jgi:hypothetical protein
VVLDLRIFIISYISFIIIYHGKRIGRKKDHIGQKEKNYLKKELNGYRTCQKPKSKTKKIIKILTCQNRKNKLIKF